MHAEQASCGASSGVKHQALGRLVSDPRTLYSTLALCAWFACGCGTRCMRGHPVPGRGCPEALGLTNKLS